MRQVPTYLIIGNGRAARHFAHYLTLLNGHFHQWDRSLPIEQLQRRAQLASHIIVLISDDAIEPFIVEHLQGVSATLIHFSGSLMTSHAYGAHPLMTFGETLYTECEYRAIPFVLDEHAPEFIQLLPGLPNTVVRLSAEQKAKYHALCVMSGNFSCLLWQKLMTHFEIEFKFPASIAHPYLERQMKNLMADYKNALTGPLPRNDVKTLDKNRQALAGDPFQQVYQAFVAYYHEVAHENS